MRTITGRVQLKKIISEREYQGTLRQEEMTGGKPPVVK
jgi:hypothetical protein